VFVARAAAAALLAALVVSSEPAMAQHPGSGGSPAVRSPTLNLQLRSADLAAPPSDKRRLAAPGQDETCAPAWPCRLQLFGYTGKYGGGVGLKGTALTW
jgi:hypothetical protein